MIIKLSSEPRDGDRETAMGLLPGREKLKSLSHERKTERKERER